MSLPKWINEPTSRRPPYPVNWNRISFHFFSVPMPAMSRTEIKWAKWHSQYALTTQYARVQVVGCRLCRPKHHMNANSEHETAFYNTIFFSSYVHVRLTECVRSACDSMCVCAKAKTVDNLTGVNSWDLRIYYTFNIVCVLLSYLVYWLRAWQQTIEWNVRQNTTTQIIWVCICKLIRPLGASKY